MEKGNIRNVIIHCTGDKDNYIVAKKISQFHADIIERRLKELDVTLELKLTIIDRIIENLKSREVNGIIK